MMLGRRMDQFQRKCNITRLHQGAEAVSQWRQVCISPHVIAARALVSWQQGREVMARSLNAADKGGSVATERLDCRALA